MYSVTTPISVLLIQEGGDPHQNNINLSDNRNNAHVDAPSKTSIQNNQNSNSLFEVPSGCEPDTPNLTTYNNSCQSK